MTDVQRFLDKLVLTPAEPEALAAIERAYSAQGRWEELLRTYEDSALRVNGEGAASLLCKAAEVCGVHLASPLRAQAYLRQALSFDKNNIGVLRTLRTSLLAVGNHDEGVAIFERELALTDDIGEKSDDLLQLAALYRAHWGRTNDALRALQEALRIKPDLPEAYRLLDAMYQESGDLGRAQENLLRALEVCGVEGDWLARMRALAEKMMSSPRLHQGAGAILDAVALHDPSDAAVARLKDELAGLASTWQERASALEQRANFMAGSPQAADLWLAVAEMYLVYGAQPDTALGAVERALSAVRGHPGALALLEEIYREQERFLELAEKLEAVAGSIRDPGVAVSVYLKAAFLFTDRLQDVGAAVRVYERILQVDPGNKVSSNRLAAIYQERQEWEKAQLVMAAWAERATHIEDKVAAHAACCRILEENLQDGERARLHHEAILALDPHNEAAARALEKVYRAAGDHEGLARALRARLATSADDQRPSLQQELTDLYAGPLDDPAAALDIAGAVFQAHPDMDRLEVLEEWATRAEAFARLTQVLEAALDRLTTTADKIRVLHTLGTLYEGPRDAPLEALRINRRILALDPEEVRAKDAVERLFESVAQSSNRIVLYREQAEAAQEGAEKVGLLKRLALELIASAKDYVQAIDVYRQILSIDAADGEAIDGLLGLYRRDERWAEVAEVLAYKADRAAGTAAASLRKELADICEHRLERFDDAAGHYLTALPLSPDDAEIFTGLERLISRSHRVVPIATVLQPRYAAAGQWDKAAAMMEIRVGESRDVEERGQLLRELAAVYGERLLQPEQAHGALLRAFQSDPGDDALRDRLERVANALGEFSGLLRAYRAAGLILEGDARAEILLRAGSLSEQQGDRKGAVLDYVRVFNAGDAMRDKAIEALRRVIEGLDPGVVVASARQVVATFEGEHRVRAWRTLARFFAADLGDASAAIGAWKAVLERSPADPEASAELDKLYQTSVDAGELVAHLRAKAEHLSNAKERIALALELGRVLAQRLQDVPAAIAELTAVAELAAGEREFWTQLADWQHAAGNLTEAAQAMHREINLMNDGPERQARLVAYAEVVGKDMGDVPTALGALQGVLAQAPQDPQAITLLQDFHASATDPALSARVVALLLPALRAAELWVPLASLLSTLADGMVDASQRIEALREIARVKAQHLGDSAGAFADLLRAFGDKPGDDGLRMELEKLAEAGDAWAQLADAYSAALGVVQDADTARAIRRRLAEILEKRLGRGSEAIEHYRSIAGGQLPDDLASLEAMERLLREQGRFSELAEVISGILGRLPPDNIERRKALLFELGQLAEEQLADKPRAIEALQALIAIDGKNLEGLRRLQRLLADLGQRDELAVVLQQLMDLGSANPQRLEDMLEHGHAMLELGRLEEAFKSYRGVLLKKREHPGALTGLERLIDLVDEKLEIAQVLEPVYTAKQDHGKLAWVLERRLQGTTDQAQRKGLMRRIGDIYENRLQQREQAFAMARRSLAEDPTDMGVRMWIEKLAGETGAQRELAEAYVEEAQKAESPHNLQFHRRAAAIFHEKLDNSAAAVAEYRAILALEGRDEKALTGLENIFRTTDDNAELVRVLEHRLEMTAGVERKREYLSEIASLQAERLAEPAAAVATYRKILALTADDVDAFGAVEKLLTQTSEWDQLGEFYTAEIERLAAKRGREVQLRRLTLTFRRGCILDQQFGDFANAAALFRAVLDEESAHGETIAYLERRASEGAVAFMALLEDVYRAQQQWQKYIQLLETKLQLTPETHLRKVIYQRMSVVYDETLGAHDQAFAAIARAYNENRADLELLDQLDALAEAHGAWQQLVDVIGTEIDALPDPKLRHKLLHRLGEITGNRLGQPDRAIGFLQQALQYEPSDQEALGSLDAILEKNEMWAALADVLERRVEVAAEPSEKSQLLERLAEVWGSRLMDAEAALRCHKQILDIDPDHPITLKSMEKLYGEVQDWDALASNLARQAEVLTDPGEQLRIHAAAGELYAEELGDMGQAIDHYLQVVALEPTHEAANQALEVLLSAEERWEELADHYRRRLKHTQSADAKLEINRRLGMILGEKLGRSDDALTSWQEVLNQDPKSLEALRALLGIYSERAMWEELVGIARRMVPLSDPVEAKDVRFVLARALGENLGRRDEAIKLAREVRATEPHTNGELVRLGEMLCNIEAWDEAVITIEKAAALEEGEDAIVARYWEAVNLYRDKLDKPNDARGCLESILAARPSDLDGYMGLAAVYRATQEWRRLVGLHEAFVPHASADLRLLILTEVRDVQDEKLGEKDLAFIAGCRVYKENPADLDAATILERIAHETKAADELAAVLEDELDNVVDSDVKVELLRRIARVYAEDLQDVTAAEETLNRILAIEPADMQALDALAQLGAREERFDKQIATLERKLGHVDEDTQRKAILFEIARIWEDKIEDIDEAISALNRVLEIDGGDPTALDALTRIYNEEGRWSELAHTLTRKVELSQDTAENVALRLRVAGICEGELDDAEAAIQWYRGVLDFESGNDAALASLERLYTAFERWSELIQIFEVQLSLTEDTEEKLRLLAKMASVYEAEFSSAKDAVACFERALGIDTSHLPTIKNLERLLRALGEWTRLIEILEHHSTLLSAHEDITGIYLEIGEIYYRELSRVDKAEQVFNKARELNPNSGAALHHLGKLYERSGNWFQSLEMLQREADAMGDASDALPILLRLGKINEDMLMDVGAAKTAYGRALAIDPSFGAALEALKNIARSEEDWDHYAEYLIAEAETSEDSEEKTDLFVEAARFFLEVREDEQSAIRFFQRALACTPAHYETSRALGDIFFRNEMWEEARELYETVLAKLDKSVDAKDFCQKSYRLGYITEKMAQEDQALRYYKQAFEADATYLPALEGLGQALLRVEHWDEAQKVYQTILIHHRESLTESEVVDIQWQLGDLCNKQGQPDRAYKQLEKALEVDPDHAATLRALATLDEQMGQWDKAYVRLGRLADVAPGNERVEVLLKMSTMADERLADLNRVIEPLERARRVGSGDNQVLDRLADAYLRASQPQKAVEVLEQAVGLAEDPAKLADLHFGLGHVLETQIKHEPMAIQHYNAALDANPLRVEAFEAIERILGARQEWSLLEANYRAMLARTKDKAPQIRLVLWRSLAELYRRVLGDFDSAIQAYEVLQKLDPGRVEDLSILAELYGQKPALRQKAIDIQHALLERSDNPVLPVRTLRKLYHANRDFDAVYVLCSVLVFLGEADEEERKIYEYLARGVPPRAARGLLDDQWKLLLDSQLSTPVGRLAAGLFRAAPDFVTEPARDLGFKKKEAINTRDSELYIANMVRYVAKVLGLPPPDVYRKTGSMDPLQVVNTQPLALAAGEANEIFRDAAQRVLLYHIGRNIACLRPELFMPRVFVGDELREMLLGLCLVYNRSLQHNADRREVNRWADKFEQLPQQALKRLQAPAREAYQELLQGEAVAIYAAAVEKTAAKVGLLAAGDLASAVRGLTEGGEGASTMPVRDRVKELVLFAVSRTHLHLRKALGAALVEGKAGG